MAYLESNLGRDEQIILKGEISMTAVAPTAIIVGILSIPSLISIMYGIDMIPESMWGILSNLIWVTFIAAILLMPKIISIQKTELGLTNKKILGKYGVINTKTMDSPIGKVNSVTVEQGLGGKIFGYAKIVISTSSGGYTFNYIKNADSFRSAVMEQIDIADEERIRKQAEQLASAIK